MAPVCQGLAHDMRHISQSDHHRIVFLLAKVLNDVYKLMKAEDWNQEDAPNHVKDIVDFYQNLHCCKP